MMAARQKLLCIAAMLSLALPVQAAAPTFSLPPPARERLIECSGANMAIALLETDATEHDNRISMSAAFAATLTNAGEEEEAVKDEMLRRASEYLDRQKVDPSGARHLIDQCDTIIGIGIRYVKNGGK